MLENDLHIKELTPLFNRKTKRLAYVMIAVLIGLVLTIEDFIEDDSAIYLIALEFVIFVPILIFLFLLFGKAYEESLKWFRLKSTFQTWGNREVIFAFTWAIIMSFLIFFLAILINHLLPDQEDEPGFFDFEWLVWVGALLFIAIVISVEAFSDMLEKRQRLEIQNERLTRSHEMAKYQALMNQINPHFLFNSLNVLSYLVYKDPKDAERFIEELSKIYRYILQLNETYVVPLKKEMEFIESYIFLQKIRYQNNLIFESKIDASSFQKLLPPLTLELLVENAIKHNVIAEKNPLHIKLFTQNGHLVVENNLQPRMENEIASNQIGLKNLLEKFEILECEPPQFYSNNGKFIAKIPLLKTEDS